MTKTIYIAKYSVGNYDDYGVVDVFVSTDKNKVTKWVTKFNRLLKEYRKFYTKFEVENGDEIWGLPWIKDGYLDDYFDRWNRLRNTNEAFYDMIEIR